MCLCRSFLRTRHGTHGNPIFLPCVFNLPSQTSVMLRRFTSLVFALIFHAKYGYCNEKRPETPGISPESAQPTPASVATWQSRDCVCVYMRGSFLVWKDIEMSQNCVSVCPETSNNRELCTVCYLRATVDCLVQKHVCPPTPLAL